MQIRKVQGEDWEELRVMYEDAFPSLAEFELVQAFHREGVEPLISLVAEDRGRVVGHIALTPVQIEGLDEGLAMGLAPMAVLKERRGQGIGQALIAASHELCRELGAVASVVLGHPEYYPRAGYVPAHRYGLRSEYDVPPEAFMALEFEEGALAKASGVVRYHALFAGV